ncbi:LCP family protein [Paenibacillus sp. GCM10023252]|uniref:LCP family protein n=1 Tax=Paenibacillus sp. GCM10023252 TaxID=3252649 RepID=UPI003613DE7C
MMRDDYTSQPPRARAAKQQQPRQAGQPKPPKRTRSALRVFLFLTLGLLLLAAVYLGYLVKQGNDALKQIGTDEVVPAEDSVKNKPVAMLMMGMDTRPVKGGTMNTDVMMVAAFNPDRQTATVVTIPRDSLMMLDGYKQRKANSYYSAFYRQARQDMEQAAAEAEAKEAMQRMMTKYFGIPVSYTGIIDFTGFSAVVNALGGVKVNVDMDMHYEDSADDTVIDLEKGEQVLDGDQALDFVRYRKSNDGSNMSNDFERNQRQSEVLGAITDKMKSLSGVAKAGAVIGAVGDNMKINMPSSEIQHMITKYFGIDRANITFIPLAGEWNSPYVYLDTGKLEEARASLQAQMAQ